MIAKLEMLIALAKEQHFGRAAERLGLSQPTLSSGIRALEDQLGVKLVLRGSRFRGLTPEGQRALEWARRIVGDSRRLREEMRVSRTGLAGHLRLAVIPTALTWAAHLATALGRAHPNVSLAVFSRNSGEILAMLENLDADAGLSYLDNEPLGRVSSVFLYRETYAAVLPQGHRLAGRAQLGWADLGGEALCLLTPDMQNRRIINRAFLDAGVSPKVRLEAGSTVVLVAHVAEAGSITVLPEGLARFLTAGKGLAVVPMAPGAQATGPAVGLVAPYQEPHTPVIQALFETARRLGLPEKPAG